MELRAETSVFDDKLLKEDINNAQDTADNAQVIAGTTAQYFWFLEEIGSIPAGVGTGAHITNKTKEEFLSNPANGGGNLLARSNGIAIRDGLTELAIFSADQLRIGRANAQRAVVNSGSLELYDAQNNKYFMVSANGLSYGSHVVATQEDIADIESTATSSTAVKTQYYLSTSASSATGGSWQDTVPTWSTGKYIWTRVATTKTTMSGTPSTSYSTAVYDRALTTALSTSESAQSSANSGASTVTTTQQFYLSTSNSSATGGSWSDSAPTWSTGHYVWTRYKIVKTTVGGTTSTSYTTGIYDKTLTDALSSAEDAKKTATNYLYVDGNGALNVASANPSTATRKVNISADGIKIQNDANNYAFVTSDGMDIYQGGNSVAFFGATARIGKEASGHATIKSDGLHVWIDTESTITNEVAFFGVDTNNNAFTQIGKSNTRHIEIKDGGFRVYRDSSNVMAHIGYGNGRNAEGETAIAPYYTFGERYGIIGNYSIVEGSGTASGFRSHAEGNLCVASERSSHAEGYGATASGRESHAEGWKTTASNDYTHAEGYESTASGDCSHAEGWKTVASGHTSHAGGWGTIAAGLTQTAIGIYNISDTTSLLIVGKGSGNDARANALTLDRNGKLTIAGTLTQNSDRRLKEHKKYLDNDAVEFIRKLKPVYYFKDNEPHLGFYAQEVESIDSWHCMTGEINGFKTLGYTEIIAPLVKYVQKLEERVKELERSK